MRKARIVRTSGSDPGLFGPAASDRERARLCPCDVFFGPLARVAAGISQQTLVGKAFTAQGPWALSNSSSHPLRIESVQPIALPSALTYLGSLTGRHSISLAAEKGFPPAAIAL